MSDSAPLLSFSHLAPQSSSGFPCSLHDCLWCHGKTPHADICGLKERVGYCWSNRRKPWFTDAPHLLLSSDDMDLDLRDLMDA